MEVVLEERKEMTEINVGDDITMNAKVISVLRYHHDNSPGEITVALKSGQIMIIHPEDINTIRPKVETDGVDKRKGN